ncbi:MAG TPA: hypothetical protein PLC54_08790 [Spirochaetales bacterium]|nr:hypothetical protein [Spirochaetales bacterium]
MEGKMPGAQKYGGAEYCPYYCEENIWRLLGRTEYEGKASWAVFVFGMHGRAAVFRQKSGQGPWALSLWDYHVVALVPDARGAHSGQLIIDFDSELGWPVPAVTWIRQSLCVPEGCAYRLADAKPIVRLLPAAEFVRRFYSDRSHMRKPDGTWQSPPPPWDSPKGDGSMDWSLASLIDPSNKEAGKLMDADELLAILPGL